MVLLALKYIVGTETPKYSGTRTYGIVSPEGHFWYRDTQYYGTRTYGTINTEVYRWYWDTNTLALNNMVLLAQRYIVGTIGTKVHSWYY